LAFPPSGSDTSNLPSGKLFMSPTDFSLEMLSLFEPPSISLSASFIESALSE
jgi:hypothetical protein